MTTTQPLRLQQDARLKTPPDARRRSIDAQLRRFAPEVRAEARRLARASSRLGDLALVFPAALHAIASPHTSAERRSAALELIEAGAPLKPIAAVLGLPIWLRRLQPEAFTGPIPPLPTSETFTRRIATRMPPSRKQSGAWLETVAFATRAAHEDFAVWLADKRLPVENREAERMFRILAAYAWFSRSRGTRGRSLIGVAWRPEIAFDTAICSAMSWFNRVRLVSQLGDRRLQPWLKAGQSGPYRFEPLLDAEALLVEARGMNNCADQYVEPLLRDRCRLFSVREKDVRVATLEIGPHHREHAMLAITQLKGRSNLPAPRGVWQEAYRWLAAQPDLDRAPVNFRPLRAGGGGSHWEDIAGPYRQATGGAPWWPTKPTTAQLMAMDQDMKDLARRGSVASWLFR